MVSKFDYNGHEVDMSCSIEYQGGMYIMGGFYNEHRKEFKKSISKYNFCVACFRSFFFKLKLIFYKGFRRFKIVDFNFMDYYQDSPMANFLNTNVPYSKMKFGCVHWLMIKAKDSNLDQISEYTC